MLVQRALAGHDLLGDDLGVGRRQALVLEEQFDLEPLDIGDGGDLFGLVSDRRLLDLRLRLAREVFAGAHRQRAGERLGHAGDDHDLAVRGAARHAGDHAERHEQAVEAAEHELADAPSGCYALLLGEELGRVESGLLALDLDAALRR